MVGFDNIEVKTSPYVWRSTVGRCKPLRSTLHWATGAHELESPQLDTDGQFSWSYTVHLITLRKTKQNNDSWGPVFTYYLRNSPPMWLPRETLQALLNNDSSDSHKLMSVPYVY